MKYINQLYDIERELKGLSAEQRQQRRQEQAKPLADKLHEWMRAQRQRVPDGSTTAKKLDYSLNRWDAWTRYLEDGRVPMDNNYIERQIRPIAKGRSLCTSFRNLGKHWELSFNVVTTRAMFARQRRHNSVAAQIACMDLP